MAWDPARYSQFQKERFAPFEDLVLLISAREGMHVIDLGCGAGELTARLAELLPGSHVVGIDSSPEMLERAQNFASPNLRFEQRSIENAEGTWDLIFSHAAIHWVHHHDALLSRFFSLLNPGGQLAIQLPSNHDHPVLRSIREIASESPFREALGGWLHIPPVLPIQEYAEILYNLGGKEITVFEKVYPHVLENSEALADWTSGTALVPYMERLDEDSRKQFQARYRQVLKERYPQSPVFFGFKRILFAATR